MTANNSLNILLVDDEVDILEPLSFNLEASGYTVTTATSGNEAFEIFKKNKFDAIITDIKMPDGNGIELLKNIKGHSPLCPVVSFVTGYSDLTLREAYHLGASSTFPKPFDFAQLKQKIDWTVAPEEERWGSNPASDDLLSIETNEERSIGSGGVCLPLDGEFYSQVEQGDLVNFRCTSSLGEISGQGWVRWIEETVGLVGIEFAFLNDSCRDKVRDYIQQNQPTPYIPQA